MSITINIFLNYSHILYFPSHHCRDFGRFPPAIRAHTPCASMADVKSPAPVPHGSWVTVCVSCVFLTCRQRAAAMLLPLSSTTASGEKVRLFGRLYQKAPRWVTFQCNAEEPRSYLSLSLHLLELATSHFASDPSINS